MGRFSKVATTLGIGMAILIVLVVAATAFAPPAAAQDPLPSDQPQATNGPPEVLPEVSQCHLDRHFLRTERTQRRSRSVGPYRNAEGVVGIMYYYEHRRLEVYRIVETCPPDQRSRRTAFEWTVWMLDGTQWVPLPGNP